MPFLRAASEHARVTLLAKPHAAPLLARFVPRVEHIALTAPWTAFTGKYRLHRWPWAELKRVLRQLRTREFDFAASARRDPRDHAVMRLAGARQRLGFARIGSGALLTQALAPPATPHRAAHWAALASTLGWSIPPAPLRPPLGRRIVIHTGAAQPARIWPKERYAELALRLRAAGWEVEVLDDTLRDLDALLARLATADRFIGNDSGPGHLAALLGVPTFTIFGPQLPELFAPNHPGATWIEGAPCKFKPCSDYCRFPEPYCLLSTSVDQVWSRVASWLGSRV